MPHVIMSGTVTDTGILDRPVLQKPFGEKELVRAMERVTQAKGGLGQLSAR
jgi:hypothetical protein